MNARPETFHAPATRTADSELQPLATSLDGDPVVRGMLDGYPEAAVLLNEQRQIVAINHALMALLGVDEFQSVVGRRLGEVLQCIHATDMAGGCGTSEACQTCGAVNVMLECLDTGTSSRGECQLTTGSATNPVAWDLEVLATPLQINGEKLMIFAARDIAAVKRRETFERLFFHDTLNVAGGLHGLAELLNGGEAFDPDIHPLRLCAMSRQLIEQISMQRDLAAAERGDLAATWSTVDVSSLFRDLQAAYESHPVARDRQVVYQSPSVDVMQTDRILLSRVLGNLIKNALEASDPAGVVTVGCQRVGADDVEFSVHNETVMPRNTQLQVFRRSFSTKEGAGRGLGTFSVKLLTTQFLGGQVEFDSTVENGTVFRVTLPLRQTADWEPVHTLARRRPDVTLLAGRRVLLVEDDPDIRRLIARLLAKAGADVSVAENGALALEAVQTNAASGDRFDLVLMDMQMPVMDGFAATRTLRATGFDAPIIALTAHAMASDRQACQDAGCSAYANKPIDRTQLIETVLQHVGHDAKTGLFVEDADSIASTAADGRRHSD